MSRFYKKKNVFLVVVGVLFFVLYAQANNSEKREEILKLFPKDPEKIENSVTEAIEEAEKKINMITSLTQEEMTFETTVLNVDRIAYLSKQAILLNSLRNLERVSPIKEVREMAQSQMTRLKNFQIEHITGNEKLYRALKTYADKSHEESLSKVNQYFLDKTIRDYERAGLGLGQREFEEVIQLKKELGKIEQEFETNIATEKRIVAVLEKDLAGLDQEFIKDLKKDEGLFILGLDYPSYFNVMNNCQVEETRRKLYLAFNNRGCPINIDMIQELIGKRDRLAELLGFESFADLDLDNQMAKTPENVRKFLAPLYEKAEKKAKKEFGLLSKNLPEGVTLSENGKIKPWDTYYIKNCYKKKHFNIDEQKIAEYFPAEHVLKETFKIFEEFFGIVCNVTEPGDLWYEDVVQVEILSQENDLLGYIFLDLYPRDDKFTHGCSETIIPSIQGGKAGANIIITNFTKPTEERPALFTFEDLETLWHELGHALHDILGRTKLASLSGMNVKEDFVEVPSQMLELWVYEKEILERISSHYKTEDCLPDEIIEKLEKLWRFDSGEEIAWRVFKSFLSLQYFSKNKDKDPKRIYDQLRNTMCPYVEVCKENNMYASFPHLADHEYASKYYCYLWAEIFSLTVFEAIKEQGLLNAKVGEKYVKEIIGKGGTEDPNVLLENFLGKKPNQKAFLKKYGLLQEEKSYLGILQNSLSWSSSRVLGCLC